MFDTNIQEIKLFRPHLGFGTGLDGFSSSGSSSLASNTSYTAEILFINLVAIFFKMFLGKIYDFNIVDNRVSFMCVVYDTGKTETC